MRKRRALRFPIFFLSRRPIARTDNAVSSALVHRQTKMFPSAKSFAMTARAALPRRADHCCGTIISISRLSHRRSPRPNELPRLSLTWHQHRLEIGLPCWSARLVDTRDACFSRIIAYIASLRDRTLKSRGGGGSCDRSRICMRSILSLSFSLCVCVCVSKTPLSSSAESIFSQGRLHRSSAGFIIVLVGFTSASRRLFELKEEHET